MSSRSFKKQIVFALRIGVTVVTIHHIGNEYTIGWLRHAEIKHGRVAMAGFVGYCLHANGVQFPIHIPGDYSTKSPAELWDQVPEAGKWQIVLFVGFLEFFSESGAAGAHYTKGGKPGAFPSFNSPEAGDQFKIPHPVPLDLWYASVHKSNRHDVTISTTPLTRRRTRVSMVGKELDPFVLYAAGNCGETLPVSGRAPRVVAVGSARRRERACPWSTDRTTHF